MLANNGLIAINLAYQNLDRAFVKDITDIESKLTLAATPKLASKASIREYTTCYRTYDRLGKNIRSSFYSWYDDRLDYWWRTTITSD